MNAPLRTLESKVIEQWIDYNGHLNEAYYLVIFSQATDAIQDYLGMTFDNIKSSGYTLFTVETHLRYLQEIGLGKDVYVTTQIIESDNKRMRLFHSMYNAQDELLATAEKLFLSYNLQQERVVNFNEEFASNLATLVEEQSQLSMPEAAGAGIALQKK
ncbi:MAG TPA: 4-hydroxybenzoyl-CoA thioesterase [Oceanospirillaceae bacterium]|nr:4-hydroxybenzoyl-CoA thioesterase [Oceanospirillaceae bacterium]